MSKAELRNRMRRVLGGLSEQFRTETSGRICRHIADWPTWQRARTVMCFISLASEVQTRQLIELAWAEGKRLLCPHIDWDRRIMTAQQLDSWSHLAVGRYGTMQSPPGMPADAAEIDLILVPGLAFDSAGNRLGRGGGYFDRFLANASGTACGLAFDCQRVGLAPIEPHDVPVRWLASESGIVRFGDP